MTDKTVIGQASINEMRFTVVSYSEIYGSFIQSEGKAPINEMLGGITVDEDENGRHPSARTLKKTLGVVQRRKLSRLSEFARLIGMEENHGRMIDEKVLQLCVAIDVANLTSLVSGGGIAAAINGGYASNVRIAGVSQCLKLVELRALIVWSTW